ncbi:MAG TPA: hypothetical protein DG753_03000 [Clostridium sp.]|nr:hypothetical protein [Clostridium sp.]
MQNKDKSDIVDAYSQNQQGPLTGRGNEVFARAENITNKNEEFTDSLSTPSLKDVQHGETYGKKEYHGI